MKRITGMVLVLAGLVLSFTAQAASFDCKKAQTKVEKLICADAGLSKLDEELNALYKTVLQDDLQADSIRQTQKQWLKERNGCKNIPCLKNRYQKRLAVLHAANVFEGGESYALVMSKNDAMCNHMRQYMNEHLERAGRTYDSHEGFTSGIEEFKRIPWEKARYSIESNGRIEYTDVEGALFDFNNDGALDFVVKDRSMLSGISVDRIYILDRSMANRANELTAKELFGADNQIGMDQVIYMLSGPLEGKSRSLWLLSPFLYDGVSYLYMQSLYKKNAAIGGDFVVIAKYIGGKFAMRKEMTGKMEDICYIERTKAR